MTPKSAALGYAKKGFAVFPCWPGDKKPIPKTGLLEATTDPKQIEKWWRAHPYANVALSCGPSGLVVIDVDPRHGGDGSLEGLRFELGPEAFDTKSQQTPSGGTHYLYLASAEDPIPNSAGVLGPGLDIRGAGGYILVPPSKNGDGGSPYVWEASAGEIPLAAFPEALRARLRPKEGSFEASVEVITGGRNQYLASMAGALRRKGLSAKEIFGALSAANKDRCKPPLSDREVETIAKSVSRYEPSDPLPLHRESAGWVDVMDMISQPEKPMEWVIDGLLPTNYIMLLAGKAGAGKSVLGRNLSASVSSGDYFLGRKCQQGSVLWISASEESEDIFKRHIRKLRPSRGIKYFPQHLLPDYPARIKWLEDALAVLNPSVVVIDTIVAFLGIVESTSYGVVSRATAPMLELRERFPASQVWLHHTNNAGGVHGQGTWERVPDIVALYTVNSDEKRYLKTIKGRGDIHLPQIIVEYDQDTGLTETPGTAWEETLARAEQAILDGGRSGAREVVAKCGVDQRAGRKALDNLVERGLYVVERDGRRMIYTPAPTDKKNDLSARDNYIYKPTLPRITESTDPTESTDALFNYASERIGRDGS